MLAARKRALDLFHIKKASPDAEGEIVPPDHVYHVEHVVMIDGAKLYAVTDMIFHGEQPIAVLIWGGKPGEEYPLVTMPLESAHLSEHRDGKITHRYERPIEEPRRRHPFPPENDWDPQSFCS